LKLSNSKIIYWGILGCGKIAHKFAQDLLTIPNAKLHAVASRSLEKSKKFGKKYNSNRHYGSYVDLCLDAAIDVIYIATPHVFHYQQTLMCLNHKKAVLCEKPFAMNANQVNEMTLAAKRNNVFLMEAMWTYFLPHYQYVLTLIKKKELGEIKHLKIDFGYDFEFDSTSRVFDKKLGGGSLLDIGIYPLFAALTMLGIPNQIKAKAKMTSTEVDESCRMSLAYESGAKAELYCTLAARLNTEAIIEFDRGIVTIHEQFHKPSSVTIKTNESTKKLNFEVNTYGYNFEAEHVTELLLNNEKESPIMSLDKSFQLIQLLDLVRSKIGLEYN
jgi:predicted dehydrogenase